MNPSGNCATILCVFSLSGYFAQRLYTNDSWKKKTNERIKENMKKNVRNIFFFLPHFSSIKKNNNKKKTKKNKDDIFSSFVPHHWQLKNTLVFFHLMWKRRNWVFFACLHTEYFVHMRLIVSNDECQAHQPVGWEILA